MFAAEADPVWYSDPRALQKATPKHRHDLDLTAAQLKQRGSSVHATTYSVDFVSRDIRGAQLVLRRINERSPLEIWGVGNEPVPQIGQVIFAHGGELSYLHIESLQVVRLASEFLHYDNTKTVLQRIVERFKRKL